MMMSSISKSIGFSLLKNKKYFPTTKSTKDTKTEKIFTSFLRVLRLLRGGFFNRGRVSPVGKLNNDTFRVNP